MLFLVSSIAFSVTDNVLGGIGIAWELKEAPDNAAVVVEEAIAVVDIMGRLVAVITDDNDTVAKDNAVAEDVAVIKDDAPGKDKTPGKDDAPSKDDASGKDDAPTKDAVNEDAVEDNDASVGEEAVVVNDVDVEEDDVVVKDAAVEEDAIKVEGTDNGVEEIKGWNVIEVRVFPCTFNEERKDKHWTDKKYYKKYCFL